MRDGSETLLEASRFEKMAREERLGPAGIAAKVGKTKKYVRGRLKLLQISEEIKAVFAEGSINLGVAIALVAVLDHHEQMLLVKQIIYKRLNQKEALVLIRGHVEKQRRKKLRLRVDVRPDQLLPARARGRGGKRQSD